MKIRFLFLLSPLFASCFWPESKSVRVASSDLTTVYETVAQKDSLIPATIDTIALHDINSDKVDDTAFVYTPPTFASYDRTGNLNFQMGCENNNCFNKVTFSCALPEIVFEESVWGFVENAGDLDGDGICELLFANDWFVGSVRSLYLYSYRNGKWKIITRVRYRSSDEPLKSALIKKGRKYYLRGIELADGDETPYEVLIQFKK
jgi:hypothetical protein